MKQTKDVLGRPIDVGDLIAYSVGGYSHQTYLRIGVVKDIKKDVCQMIILEKSYQDKDKWELNANRNAAAKYDDKRIWLDPEATLSRDKGLEEAYNKARQVIDGSAINTEGPTIIRKLQDQLEATV